MLDKLDEKIKTLVHALHEEGFVIKGIRNGIRLKLETGADIDIYALKSDPSHIRARLKLFRGDENSCGEILEDLTLQLRKGFGRTATMEKFRLTKKEEGLLTYYARINMGNEACSVLPETPPSETLPDEKGVQDDRNDSASPDNLEIAVELLETVDSKMFRQALDDLGLARSSFLRVVLTRIFRAAADSEELKIVMEEEAERITDIDDMMELEQICNSNTIDFLNPVLELLHQYSCGESGLEMDI